MKKENCSVCMEPMTNPVCVNCYTKQLRAWLKTAGVNEIKTNSVITRVRKKLPMESLSGDNCVLCSGDDLRLCTYCFFDLASKTLKEMKFPQEAVLHLGCIFNYE